MKNFKLYIRINGKFLERINLGDRVVKKIALVLICAVFLVGCNNKTEDNKDKEKVTAEIEYFGTEIAQLLNDLNNISLDNYELVSDKINIDKKTNNSSISQEADQGKNQGDSQSQGGSNEQSENQDTNSGDKKENEVSITSMKHNTILNVDTEEIDWDTIKNKIELLNDSWDIVMLELYKANVSNDDIMAFDTLLNQTIISIKNDDKKAALINLGNMYYYIPKFLNSCSADKYEQNIQTTKYNVLAAYVYVSQDDWGSVQGRLTEAESSFLSVVNDTERTENKEFKVNKTYMLIKDLQNSVKNNDKQLFLVKYVNLMKSLNAL